MKVGTLEIDLMAQMARLSQDMKQAEAVVGSSMKNIEVAAHGAKMALELIGVGLGVGVVVEFAKTIVELGTELTKMSQKIGISVEDLSKLRYAGSQTDVSMEQIGKGMKKLSMEMVAGGDSTTKAGKLMSAMGVDLKGGLGPALETVADTFAAMPDGPTKAALAVQLFGKAGMDLIPLLNQGGDGIRKMKEEAQRLGLVISQETAEKLKELNESLKTLKLQSEAAGLGMLETLLPSLKRITAALIEARGEGGLFHKILVGIGGIMAESIGLNDDGAERMANYIQGLRDANEGLRAMEKAGADLLPGERAQMELNDREIKQYDDLAKARRKAAEAAENTPTAMMQRAGIAIGDAVMEKIKKANEARISGILSADDKAEDMFKKEMANLDKEMAKLQGVGELKAYLEKLDEKSFEKLDAGQKKTLENRKNEIILLQMKLKYMADILASDAAALNAEQKLKDLSEAYTVSLREQVKEEQFAASLIGKTADEAAKATKMRQLDLDLEKRILEVENSVGGDMGADQNRIVDAMRKQNDEAKQSIGLSMDRAAASRNEVSVWNELADRGSQFFDELVFSGKKAMDIFHNLIKSLISDMLKLFVRRWILNIGASGNVDVAGSAAQAGAGSLAGSLLGGATSLFGYGTGAGLYGSTATFLGAASGSIPAAAIGTDAVAAGVGVDSLAATSGAWMAGLSATGWGLIIVAAIAVLAHFFGSHGGPKMEGQFAGTYDASGRLVSSSRPLNIQGTGADNATQQYVTSLSQAFFTALQQLGGTTTGITFGGGVVKDPEGKSPTFVDTFAQNAAGQDLFRVHNANVGRSDEELQAELQLQSQRAILAALQSSELPSRIADIFSGMDANTASAEEITAAFNKANATQQAYVAAWSNFNNLFMTDAEKVSAAQDIVNAAFDKLGVTAPKTAEEFKAMVKAAHAAGDNKLEDALLGVADAFKIVSDASQAAHDAMLSTWDSMQNDIDKILGRDRTSGQLSDLTSQFQAGHSQFDGLTPQQLIQVLTTITQADFANYSAADQKLIAAILSLGATMTQSSATISTAISNFGPAPPVLSQTLQQQFQTAYGGVINAEPDESKKLSLQIKLMNEQIASWTTQADYVARTQGYYSQQYIELENAIMSFQSALYSQGGLTDQLAQLTILTAQYGEQKAEQLLSLQQWYAAQVQLIGSNTTALDALKVIFKEKWDAIIGGVAGSDALASAKSRLSDWWHGLFLDQTLSPLSPQQQLEAARAQYQTTLALAQGGDVTAIGRLSGDADTYLKLAREIFASSNIYTAIFRDVAQATGTIAGISQTEINTRLYGALPTTGTLATSADIAALTASVNDLISMFENGDATVSDPTLAESIDNLATKVATGTGALA